MGRSALLMPALACPRLLTVLNNKEGKGMFAHFHDARFRTFRGATLGGTFDWGGWMVVSLVGPVRYGIIYLNGESCSGRSLG